MIIIATYFVWFMFYSFVGWVWEVMVRAVEEKKLINTGFLNGPYCPIYGFGVIFMVVLLSKISSPFLLFLASGSLACILEYITSWGMEKIFHMRWWDYSKDFLNIKGRVCLKGFLAFGILGSLVVKVVHPLVANFTFQISTNILFIIAAILLVVLLTDLIYTIIRLTKFNKKLKKLTKEFNEFLDQAREQREELSDKLREEILARFNESQIKFYIRLNLLEKHLLRDYPRLRSTRYNDALQNVRKQVKKNKAAQKSKSNSTSKSKSDTKSKKE